ncbi:phenylalanine--tRNA ligase subunit beta [Campylobacter canadensis]|uniref:Phenylalanine--tRNA ligase beta subunit n=1 Tax=Campylobacter canadensis TaxID=449520 RepID=A0ABS7WR86_9BACT|nr:phenylalanine--tRNA ligase subunit beta [Campylobacter canadensis]MBZ7987280.1 phenylalanine--tRNA ligase subunit beta [Campylobacter canadensis]MBZ7994358.1 phenylalanine--tRNA ligase subunit beta [Campylobacter canadensis]MBZ7996055.1 phenylalanine--tRNA ligase subunit beta [Campylobacter canadensis]MBZ7998291.1 phenylalanine--tRNA ligase subunit beta [Campylobacter canadensis]MBZ7999691.1 phenylalanine--tRNA ligase subunit beta [Campylobacter canadensis]
MIISRNWLNEFIDLKEISTDELVKTLNSIGLEVDSVKKITVPKDVVVAKVLSKEKHPDADKLSICMLDIGTESLQVVCGAKNVAEGEFVALSKIGACVNDMLIKQSKLRGVDSYGMICSSTELGLAKINDGIMILDDSIGELVLGKQLCEYEIFNDELIEIELTPNRGDCLSINGIARDLSAALEINLKEKLVFKDGEKTEGIKRILNVHFDGEVNSHFNIKAFELEEEINPSFKILFRLACVDALKDNSILNLLEYAIHASGVVINAYDFAKISKNDEQTTKISVIKKENDECAILTEDKKEIGVAGIYQNKDFTISNESKKILIVASHTNPNIIANSYKKYKDCDIYRSFRGSEPDLNIGVDYLFNILQNIPKLKLYGSSCQNNFAKEKISISFNLSEINNKIGHIFERNYVADLLKRLNYELNSAEDNIFVKVPYYRHDIKNSADISEEIVRIFGIDNVKAKALTYTESNKTNNTYLAYKKALALRQNAVNCGYFESVSYVFESKEFLDKLNMPYIKNEIINPISNEFNTLRSSVVSSLIKQAIFNFNNAYKGIKLFELGIAVDENSKENKYFALINSGLYQSANLKNNAKGLLIDFFTFLQDLKNILGDFELRTSTNFLLSEAERCDIYKNGKNIGFAGRLNATLCDEFKLPRTYVAQINVNEYTKEHIEAKAYSKFPGTSRDLSILVPKNYDYNILKNFLLSLKINNLKEFKIIDLYKDSSLGEFESLSINFEFISFNGALKNEDINNEMNLIIEKLQELGLKLR